MLNPLALQSRFGGKGAGVDGRPIYKFGEMRRLDFKKAARLIREVAPDLEADLSSVWDQASKARRAELCFFLAKYPYKSFVFKDGQALDPDGSPVGDELLGANQLPVGLILDNVLEVVDEVIRHEEVIEFPQSLLLKSHMIGLWEFIDQQLKVEGRPWPNWTISSGSRSIKFLEFPTQKVKWDKLRGRYRGLPPFDKRTVRNIKEIELIRMISEVDARTEQWGTQVLYFCARWFEEMERQRIDSERSGPADKLFLYLQNTSWSTLARIRYNDDQLTDALTEWGGDSNVALCKAAYLLLRHSVQAFSQRRPCFGLAGGSDSSLAPLDTLKTDLLQAGRLNETILVPMYLHENQVGFLSLSQLVPSAFNHNPEDSLEYIFKIIAHARDEAARRNVSVPGLDGLPQLFDKLTFRVRSGRRHRRGRHGSVLTFKVRYSPTPRGHYEKESVPIESFYEPFFPEDRLPPSDSRFFRVAMKLDLRG
jgi:hypothetical protein